MQQEYVYQEELFGLEGRPLNPLSQAEGAEVASTSGRLHHGPQWGLLHLSQSITASQVGPRNILIMSLYPASCTMYVAPHVLGLISQMGTAPASRCLCIQHDALHVLSLISRSGQHAFFMHLSQLIPAAELGLAASFESSGKLPTSLQCSQTCRGRVRGETASSGHDRPKFKCSMLGCSA